jgi:recombination protein RecT
MSEDTKSQLMVLRETLKRGQKSIDLAIPAAYRSRISADSLIRLAEVMALKNPEILKCDPVSVGASVRDAAMLGLQFDGLLGHGHLVPRWSSKQNRMLCAFQIGYKGLMALAWRSGNVESVDAECVHKGDEFNWRKGLNPILDHNPTGQDRTAFTLTHAWACIRFRGGGFVFVVKTKAQLEAIKLGIRGWEKGLWNGPHYPAMCRKTALRAVCQLADLSIADQRIIAKDEALDRGDDTELDEAEGVIPPEPKDLPGEATDLPVASDPGVGAAMDDEPPPPTVDEPPPTRSASDSAAARVADRRRRV